MCIDLSVCIHVYVCVWGGGTEDLIVRVPMFHRGWTL